MPERYLIRPDPRGFSVLDRSTGEVAAIAGAPQAALSREDADHLASMLNSRARDDDRSVRQ